MNETDSIEFNIKNSNIIAKGISDRGCVRAENEDSIWVDESGLVLLLADGMGGHERGAEASSLAINNFRSLLTPSSIKEEMNDITAAADVPLEIASLYTIIFRAVGRTANSLYNRNMELKLSKYMGTTIVGIVLVEDKHVLWFHIGDSRLYRMRDNNLECLTTDHSAYAEWVSSGSIGTAPAKNLITRVMGINPGVEAEIEWDGRMKDDIFILCSDGLSDMITDEDIMEIINRENDVDSMADSLVSAATGAGGKDNISVIVCKTL